MAHHKDKAANIVVLNPWVVFKARSRVPFDFPATFQNTMDILLYAVEVAEAQEAYFLEHVPVSILTSALKKKILPQQINLKTLKINLKTLNR